MRLCLTIAVVSLGLALSPAAARSEVDDSRWRVGVVGGLTLSRLGGHDADVVAEEGTTAAPAVGARMAVMDEQMRWSWRIQLESSFVQRKVGSWIFSHLEAPVLVEAGWRQERLVPFANVGVSMGWVIGATRPSSGGERGDLEAAALHVAALAGVGVRQRDPGSAWSTELRYAHGMTSLDPETPGIDVRHRTIMLLVGWETSL